MTDKTTPISRRTALAGAAGLASMPAVAKLPGNAFLERVADGVWMHTGATEGFSTENGGDIANIAVLETEAGALVIDTGSSRLLGERIRLEIEQRFGGLAATILTHHHPDHTFGTQALADQPIMALPETAARAEANLIDYSDLLYREVGLPMRGTSPALPSASVGGGAMTIGGRRLELLPLGGHTEADLALLDVTTGTLIAGDLLFLGRAPTVPDADLARWHATLDTLEALGAAAAIPGHGPLDRTGAAILQTRAYLEWLAAQLTSAAGRGLSMIEAMGETPPASWASLGANPEEFRRSVVQSYAAYETEALPLLR
ncbi:MAG: quinoprotein relay system zinc metallohydrolase 1 [Pseudomonadota bacterium]